MGRQPEKQPFMNPASGPDWDPQFYVEHTPSSRSISVYNARMKARDWRHEREPDQTPCHSQPQWLARHRHWSNAQGVLLSPCLIYP